MTTEMAEKKGIIGSLGTISASDFAAVKESVLDGFLKANSKDAGAFTRSTLLDMIKNAEAGQIECTEDGLIPLENADFSGADLRIIDFSLFKLQNVTLMGAKLDRKSLQSLLPAAHEGRVSLRGINLEGQDLSGKVVNRADIGIVSLVRVSMEKLDLRDANFKNANLSHVDFDESNLMGANLEGANLSKALVRNACLINADMMGVNLTEAKLNGTDLRGADLRQANIREANLTGVKL